MNILKLNMSSDKCILQNVEFENKLYTLLSEFDKDSCDITSDINILISKCEEIKIVFEDDDFNREILIGDALAHINSLRSALLNDQKEVPMTELGNNNCPTLNVVENRNADKLYQIQSGTDKFEENLIECNINDLNCATDCRNCINILEQYELLKRDNDEIREKINILEHDKSEIILKLNTEKEEDRKKIELLSYNLEQHIAYTASGITLNHGQPDSDLIVDSTISDLVMSSKYVTDVKEDHITDYSGNNMSILDLDAMHMDSLCLTDENTGFTVNPGISHERAQHNLNDSNNSCYNLDILNSELLVDDSKNMLEELDQLDWEDRGKMDLLIGNSISIFMKSVLIKLDCRQNSRIEHQLKKAFAEYGNALTKKLKSIQSTYDDLNNTCVFEKLELEMQLDVELSDAKKQLELVTAENGNLAKKIGELKGAKEESDDSYSFLKLETTNVASELKSAYENLKMFQSRSEELEIINELLEASSQALSSIIEGLNAEKELIMLAKQNSDKHVECLTLELSTLTSELESTSDTMKNSQARLEELEKLDNDMENSLKVLQEEIQMIKTEKETLMLTKMDNDNHVESLKLEISRITGDLESALGDLKNSLCESNELKELNSLLESSSALLENEIQNLNTQLEEAIITQMDRDALVAFIELKLSNLTTELETAIENLRISELRMEELNKLNGEMETSSKVLQDEIDRLNVENEEITLAKLDSECHVESMKLEVSNVTIELNSSFETLKNCQVRLEELEKINCEMETSSKVFQDEIQKLNDKIEELMLAKMNSDICVESLRLEISNMTSEYESTLNILEKVQSRSEEMEKFNEVLESSSQILRDEIERLNICKESIATECKSLKEELNLSKINLENVASLLESTKEEHNLLVNEKNTLEDKFHEMEQKMCDVFVEKSTAVKVLEDEIEMLRVDRNELCSQLSSTKTELDDLNQVMVEKENHIIDLKNVIKLTTDKVNVLESDLNSNMRELEEAMNACITTRGELERVKLTLLAKEEQLAQIENRVCEEGAANFENNTEIIVELQTQLVLLKDENVNLQEIKNEMEIKLNNLSIKSKDTEVIKEKMMADLTNLQSENSLQANIILQMKDKLKCQEEETNIVSSELTVARQDSIMKEESLMITFESRCNDYKGEIENLKKSLLDSETELQKCENLLNKKNSELQLKESEIDDLKINLTKSLLAQQNENNRTVSSDNKENVNHLETETSKLREEVTQKNELIKGQQSSIDEYDMLVRAYNELKDRYREKRRRTDELNVKYEKLVKLCKEKGIMVPRVC